MSKTYNLSFIDGSPGDLEVLYNELTMVTKRQEQRIMSQETKKQVKEAGEFFKKVQQDAEKYKSIPDKDLGGKIQKVQEGAGEVVKHIQEKTGSNG
jgi:hypothetical protein